jgi:hypothetical protein
MFILETIWDMISPGEKVVAKKRSIIPKKDEVKPNAVSTGKKDKKEREKIE